MNRLPLVAVAFTISVFGLTVGFSADDKHSSMHDDCAKACNECQRICDACSNHCARLIADGKKEHLATLQSCQDCAAICSTSASIVARKGPFSDVICMACSDACKRCGDQCAKLGDDAMMKKCSEECRKCEKACQDMLKHATTK